MTTNVIKANFVEIFFRKEISGPNNLTSILYFQTKIEIHLRVNKNFHLYQLFMLASSFLQILFPFLF